MEKKFNGGSVVLLSIVLVATLIVAVIGATYAYFRAQVMSVNVSSMVIKAANLKVTYTETQNINVSAITPGWTSTKTFTIANTGNGTVNYTISWSNVVNGLTNKQYLKYTLNYTGGANGCKVTTATQYPITNATPEICSGSIAAGATAQQYTLTMTYANDTSYDQSSDMNAVVTGTINVVGAQVSQQ